MDPAQHFASFAASAGLPQGPFGDGTVGSNDTYSKLKITVMVAYTYLNKEENEIHIYLYIHIYIVYLYCILLYQRRVQSSPPERTLFLALKNIDCVAVFRQQNLVKRYS
jgi:hypothetical protein